MQWIRVEDGRPVVEYKGRSGSTRVIAKKKLTTKTIDCTYKESWVFSESNEVKVIACFYEEDTGKPLSGITHWKPNES